MSKFVGWVGAAALSVTVAAAPLSAQIEAGDRSVGVQGLIATLTGDESFTFGMGYLSFNKFQTKKFAWRLNAVIQVSDAGDGMETSTGLGGGLEWNFNSEGLKTIPFVAIDAQQFMAKDQNMTMLSPSIGFRSFVSRSTSFDVAVSYNTIVAGGGDISGGLILARMGFSYYLGKDPRR